MFTARSIKGLPGNLKSRKPIDQSLLYTLAAAGATKRPEFVQLALICDITVTKGKIWPLDDALGRRFDLAGAERRRNP
jgi:hypothetical protein